MRSWGSWWRGGSRSRQQQHKGHGQWHQCSRPPKWVKLYSRGLSFECDCRLMFLCLAEPASVKSTTTRTACMYQPQIIPCFGTAPCSPRCLLCTNHRCAAALLLASLPFFPAALALRALLPAVAEGGGGAGRHFWGGRARLPAISYREEEERSRWGREEGLSVQTVRYGRSSC